jgi:hypothetical protein
MTVRYTTPRQLEDTLEWHLRRAGFKDPVTAHGTRYVEENGEACLKASVFEYSATWMAMETLQGYEQVLREMPGVMRTEIVHEDAKNHREGTKAHSNPLRDQVIVIHRRMWNEPDLKAAG